MPSYFILNITSLLEYLGYFMGPELIDSTIGGLGKRKNDRIKEGNSNTKRKS